MKKLVLIFFTCFIAQQSFGQTEDETLEWLRVKKSDVSEHWSTSNHVASDAPSVTLLFDNNFIKVASSNGAWTKINWDKIKDIKIDNPYIRIISATDYKENEKYYIRIKIESSVVRDKYFKALKHMAELKGAVLLKEDLF